MIDANVSEKKIVTPPPPA